MTTNTPTAMRRRQPAKPRAKQPVDVQAAILRDVTEAQLQAAVIECARTFGWRVNHVYDSRMTGPDKGVPDLLLARRGRVIFAELKDMRRKVSPEQVGWMGELSLLGAVEVYLWRPTSWQSGEIDRILA